MDQQDKALEESDEEIKSVAKSDKDQGVITWGKQSAKWADMHEIYSMIFFLFYFYY